MPQKKQQFRFRMPWKSGARPKQRSKSPSKSDTNVPIQRLPFRPPGIAPAPPQSVAQGTPTAAEPQQQSPTSSVIIESPMSSPSESPSRPSTSTHVNSPLPSPSRTTQTQTQHSSLSLSSSNEGSPSHLPPKPAADPASSQEKEKMKSPLKIIPIKLKLEKQSKSHQSKGKEKVVQEPIKVENGNDNKYGQSIRRSKAELHTTAASASGVQTKDAFSRAFQADKQQKEAKETVERKMMFATSGTTGKDIKVVSSADAATRNVSSRSISPEKQNSIEDDISKLVDRVNSTQPMDEETVSVVTLAGDNRGATMHVGSHSRKKRGSINIHRAYRTNPAGESTDGEENSCSNSMEKAYVNSNIQSVNNSMLLQGSISDRDPGVRVILPQQQPAEAIKPKPVETRKGEVNIKRAEKLSYQQPVIRRRCLRGLFLEPSESEPDKPRRHGCKFRCGEIRKDKDKDKDNQIL